MAASLRALFMFRRNHCDVMAPTTPGESYRRYREDNRKVTHCRQDVGLTKEGTPQPGHAIGLRIIP
jgi:hypothetical protein